MSKSPLKLFSGHSLNGDIHHWQGDRGEYRRLQFMTILFFSFTQPYPTPIVEEDAVNTNLIPPSARLHPGTFTRGLALGGSFHFFALWQPMGWEKIAQNVQQLSAEARRVHARFSLARGKRSPSLTDYFFVFPLSPTSLTGICYAAFLDGVFTRKILPIELRGTGVSVECGGARGAKSTFKFPEWRNASTILAVCEM